MVYCLSTGSDLETTMNSLQVVNVGRMEFCVALQVLLAKVGPTTFCARVFGCL